MLLVRDWHMVRYTSQDSSITTLFCYRTEVRRTSGHSPGVPTHVSVQSVSSDISVWYTRILTSSCKPLTTVRQLRILHSPLVPYHLSTCLGSRTPGRSRTTFQTWNGTTGDKRLHTNHHPQRPCLRSQWDSPSFEVLRRKNISGVH